MPLERKQSRTVRPKPASFRFSREALDRLKVLSITLNMSQVEVLEALLVEEYERAKKKYPDDMRKAERQLGSSK